MSSKKKEKEKEGEVIMDVEKVIEKMEGNINDEERGILNRHEFVPKSGWEAIQGRRWDMQDTHVAIDDLRKVAGIECNVPISFYAIYDGHGGREAAHLCDHAFLCAFTQSQEFKDGDYEAAIRVAFDRVDLFIKREARSGGWVSGTTAAVAVIADDRLYIGNLGDSEIILGRRRQIWSSKYDSLCVTQRHTPAESFEKTRIEAAGGTVSKDRINGQLAVSRAFGDIAYRDADDNSGKDLVSGVPFVHTYDLALRDDFIVLACDGLYDTLEYKNVSDLLAKQLRSGKTPTQSAEALVRATVDKGTSDNVSTIVVYLYKRKRGETSSANFAPESSGGDAGDTSDS
jgi:integrin-linked kinase-associated serine/threonine phosphatase 2C